MSAPGQQEMLDAIQKTILEADRRREESERLVFALLDHWAERACPYVLGNTVALPMGPGRRLNDVMRVAMVTWERAYHKADEFPFQWVISGPIVCGKGKTSKYRSGRLTEREWSATNETPADKREAHSALDGAASSGGKLA